MTTTSNYPEWVDEAERQIIDKLIDTILGAGCQIEVQDEEGESGGVYKHKSEIQSEVGATGETIFSLYRPDGGWGGNILLIHGNGCDVISDHTDTPFMETMVRPAQDLADKLSEEGL